MAKRSLNMKLLIDTKCNRVLFAEAHKDCVDFLFHMLSLPLATVVSLLKAEGMAGSVKNLYDSIDNLDETYVQPQHTKDSLLKPKSIVCACSVPELQLIKVVSTEGDDEEKKIYRCGYCSHNSYSCYTRAKCPSCRRDMAAALTYVAPPPATTVNDAASSSEEVGFVKGVVTNGDG